MLNLVKFLGFLPSGISIFDFDKIQKVTDFDDLVKASFEDVTIFFKEFGLDKSEKFEINIMKLNKNKKGETIGF